jgi:hypothetical protein
LCRGSSGRGGGEQTPLTSQQLTPSAFPSPSSANSSSDGDNGRKGVRVKESRRRRRGGTAGFPSGDSSPRTRARMEQEAAKNQHALTPSRSPPSRSSSRSPLSHDRGGDGDDGNTSGFELLRQAERKMAHMQAELDQLKRSLSRGGLSPRSPRSPRSPGSARSINSALSEPDSPCSPDCINPPTSQPHSPHFIYTQVSGFLLCQLNQIHTFTDLYLPLSTLGTLPPGAIVAAIGSSELGFVRGNCDTTRVDRGCITSCAR